MKKKDKNKIKKLIKSSLREFFKENNLLNRWQNKTFKNKKKYSRKNKDWKE